MVRPPVSYPGVYVQEVPSGVRTIAGVPTSIAAFIGRAADGPLEEPIQCLNFGDFDRNFSSEYVGSDLARAVRLFFQNGGSRCYVVRTAREATFSETTLKNEAQVDVLKVKAKSAGVKGDSIRLVVTYNGLSPEATFNLEIFRWAANERVEIVREGMEIWQALTMEPHTPRYAVDFINQNSALVELTDLTSPPATSGYSQSGRPVPSLNETEFRNQWMTHIGKSTSTNEFRIYVDGKGPFEINLLALDFVNDSDLNTPTGASVNLAGKIAAEINQNLPSGSNVTVTFEEGPVGIAAEANGTTKLLRIASPNGDVRIEPASQNDLAVPLMLGTPQGGLEISRYAESRPAPNGLVFDKANLTSFAEQAQTAFDTLNIGATSIPLGNSLESTPGTLPDGVSEARMYHDGYSPSPTNNHDGMRQKWVILANAINAERENNSSHNIRAEVWGSRLALIAGEGSDNSQISLSTTTSGVDGVDIGPYFLSNVRYYSLGNSGTGSFQTAAARPAQDGDAPWLEDYRRAFHAIDQEVDIFNILLLPQDEDHSEEQRRGFWGPASVFCQKRRAFLLMDAPDWQSVQEAIDLQSGVNGLRTGLVKDHSAVFYPQLMVRENGIDVSVGPSGAIAGLISRIDSTRGVWKAAAGIDADLRGDVRGVRHRLSDSENGIINPRGINTIRVFPNGIVNWGARTMDGDDDFGSEYKYIPVRRLALFIEESLYRGLKWVVFEPNDEPLWAQIRLNVGAFMHDLFRQGAFQGQKKDAYFVKCDAETTTQNDINLGIVNIWVGFAPLKPAEFVILYLQQMAGQIQT